MTVVSLMAQGAMGAAVGARLVAGGLTVQTCLDGRSAASAKRAQAAGMVAVGFAELAQADLVLSIVPPASALGFAEELAPHIAAVAAKPLFVDCNAVDPQTVQRIAAVIAPTGAGFVDAGIIGAPPRPDYQPSFFAAGAEAGRMAELLAPGLRIKLLDGPVGAASGLKMSYAGISKGSTALAAAMALAATRFGAATALRDELAQSLPFLLGWLDKQVPAMFPKAYRWVAEMEEISVFLAADPPAAEMFRAIGAFYQRLAEDAPGQGGEIDALAGFFTKP